MKTTFKTLILLAVLSSCNHNNSPAPASPAPSNPTPTANTPENVASSLVGHWYLDSTVDYSNPSNHVITKYGFNYVFTYPNDMAQHKEMDLKATITTSLTASALSTQSHGRELHSILWFRKANNDTTSYIDQSPLTWAVVANGNDMALNSAGGYIRNLNNNLLQTASNVSATKTGLWSYWHRQ